MRQAKGKEHGMKHRIYNAGPFFNSAQRASMDRLEALEKKRGLDFFAPRLSPETERIAAEGFTPEIGAEIFERDVAEIGRATVMVAMLDWALPEGEEIRHVGPEAGQTFKLKHYHKALSRPLNLPDSGTVWEMGRAHAQALPVIACRFDLNNPLNVMLTESSFGVCTTWPQVELMLDVLAAWKGDRL
jgi:nucleoside 2-deoxyribosyltransferase